MAIASTNIEDASTNEFVLYALLVNGAIGAVLGLIPVIIGIKKGNTKLGVLGFAASVAGSLLLGLILSLPAAAIFTWLILRRKGSVSAQPE